MPLQTYDVRTGKHSCLFDDNTKTSVSLKPETMAIAENATDGLWVLMGDAVGRPSSISSKTSNAARNTAFGVSITSVSPLCLLHLSVKKPFGDGKVYDGKAEPHSAAFRSHC